MKNAYCIYLYSDGHAVCIFEKDDKQAGKVQWVEIWEKFGPDCSFPGRIVFHNCGALVALCRRAHRVTAKQPSTKNGSEKTKEMGIRVGSLTIQTTPHWDDTIHLHDMPDILAAAFTIQDENNEVFDPGAYAWCGHRVHKIHRLPSALKVEVAA